MAAAMVVSFYSYLHIAFLCNVSPFSGFRKRIFENSSQESYGLEIEAQRLVSQIVAIQV